MRHLFLFFITISAFGQNVLKAEIYNNLKPRKSIVLDTGSFTFTGLEMKDIEGEIWLDARKAKSLTLNNCRFERNKKGKGIAVLVHCSLTITNSLMRNMWCGIQIAGNGNTCDIQKNTFENLRYGLWLREGAHPFANFRCNVFKHTLAASGGTDNLGTGLYVGAQGSPSVAPSITGNIGGNGNQSIGNPNPNANVWPKDPNNTTQSPSNWVSIQKPDAGGQLTYFGYSNEVIGTVYPQSLPNRVFVDPYRSAKSPYFIKNWCDAYHGGNVNSCYTVPTNFLNASSKPWQDSWDAVCENLGDDFEFFARQAVAGDTIGEEKPGSNQSVLGNPIPNPSAGKTYIPVLWLHERGNLQVFELTSGKVVASKPIRQGRQMVEFELSSWPSGVYGYRLEGEGKCPEPKKLIIIH